MNLFPNKGKRPYYVASPSYNHMSSGIRSLHLLCHALNEAGMVARMIPYGAETFYVNHNLNTPVAAAWDQFEGPIVVYPDSVKGNPLGAKRVVRYLMAPRGAYGGDSVFPETDQVWGNLPSIAENVLRIPVCDTNIFWGTPSLPRCGSCFYALKYDRIFGHKLLPLTDGMTRLEGSLEELAYILRCSERCYVYEMTSAMTEAALCGCPVTLIKTDFFNTIDPTAMMGDVMWDDGQIVKQCDDYLPEYLKEIESFEGQLKHFINKTQEML